MKALVVGGAGFVGSELVRQLLTKGDEVVVLDNLLSSEPPDIKSERYRFIHGDGGNLENYSDIGRVDTVYLLHCLHGNQSSITNPILDLQHSLMPTVTALQWVRTEQTHARVVYAGAGCAVAAKTWESPLAVEETDAVGIAHDSPYSISKLTGEMHASWFARVAGVDAVRVRFQNVFGPGEILGAGIWRGTEHTVWRNVIPTFIWRAIHGRDLHLYGTGASRDFVFVGDIAQGLDAAAQRGRTGEVYNLASGREVAITHLATDIIRLAKSRSSIVQHPARTWDHSGRRFGSVEKSRREIGFLAQTTLQEGLAQQIEWTLANREIIAETIRRHGWNPDTCERSTTPEN